MVGSMYESPPPPLSLAQATRVHYLMGVLLLFKTLSLVFETAMFSYVARVGHTNGWSVLYDIATFVKGTMLFTVIVLLGTGWSSLKPYLSDRERKILLIVLPLQVPAFLSVVVCVVLGRVREEVCA